MSPSRPDLVECFVFRLVSGATEPEILLIRRAPGRIFAGLWQPVTGGILEGESVPTAALREVGEEVGLTDSDILGFYDLDQATHFYDEGTDAIVSGAIFAVRADPEARPRLSDEHDAHRWAVPAEAARIAVWPTYRESIARIVDNLLDPERAGWFELDGEGRRLAR
jgi:dATP pyrophosphohydrolase